MIFTLSFDDGHPLNLKLLELLNKYNLKATFYIEGNYLKDKKTESEVLEISQTQEIGAHTLTHPKLNQISLSEVEKEVRSGKEKLENLLGQQVEMFSYPYGIFNEQIKNIVKNTGFLGGRTAERFIFNRPQDFFEFGTTFQIYPHPFRKRDARHLHGPRVVLQPLLKNAPAILKYRLPLTSFFSWFNLTKNLFNYCYKNGEIFHLWGHAFEIEKYGMWVDLEKFFSYIKTHPNIIYLTNSQALKYFHENPAH